MKKWIAGVAATVISSVLAFWLTEGFTGKQETPSPYTNRAEQPTAIRSETGAPTLFDMRGVYTLVKIEPSDDPIVPGNLGIGIQPRTATEGTAQYRLPLEIENVGDVFADTSEIVLVGSRLQIRFSEEFSLWRNVEFSGRHLILSWDAGGQKNNWIFERNE